MWRRLGFTQDIAFHSARKDEGDDLLFKRKLVAQDELFNKGSNNAEKEILICGICVQATAV